MEGKRHRGDKDKGKERAKEGGEKVTEIKRGREKERERKGI